jgi:hypothetical protein
MAPTWYLLAAAVVGQVAMHMIPESAPVRVAKLYLAQVRSNHAAGKQQETLV